MIDGANLKFDGFSFLLGLVGGVILSIFLYQFRGWLPAIRSIFNRNVQKFKERNFSGIDGTIRQEILRRAQHAHLSSQLFSLDEILIPPKLLAYPTNQDPSQTEHNDFIMPRLFPNNPDWPEIPSQYPIDFINISEAIQKGANIVVLGAPGTGKSVALAHLASQFARKDPSLGNFSTLLPIYLHILDFLPQTDQDLQGMVDPLDLIIRTTGSRLPVWYQGRSSTVIRTVLSEGAAILLLDGMDELPAHLLKKALGILQKLKHTLPKLRIVITATPISVGEILEEGFYPLSLAAWNLEERKSFIHTWGKLWNEKLVPEMLKKDRFEPLDPVFGSSWLSPQALVFSPLEWTLLLWGVYSGDISKLSVDEALRAYVLRLAQNQKILSPIYRLAIQMITDKKISIDQYELDELVKRNAISAIQFIHPGEGPQAETKKETSTGLFLQEIAKTGLLTEHPGHIFRFCHSLILGYCAAYEAGEEIDDWATDPEIWDAKSFTLGFAFSQKPASFTIMPGWVRSDEPPLYRSLLWFSRTIHGLPFNHPMRTKLMRRMVDGLVDDRNYFSTRLAFASALAVNREPGVIQYFQQLLTSPKSDLRQIGSLMLGAIQEARLIPELTALLTDPIEPVRQAACCALGNISTQKSMAILESCITVDDDIVRQAATESLAANQEYGHDILKKSSQSENLLSRRSVVFGLARINTPWARELLEQIAIKDSQWVVRNAASQAIEILQHNYHLIPEPLPMASESSWLIAFAGRQGKGIQQGDPAIDILIDALHSGTAEERMAALEYLRLCPQENVLQAVYKMVNQPDPALRSAAELAIWYLNCIKPDAAKVSRSTIL